ncbi:MAG: thermonuclease family protein [Bacteriovoracaceae bacterium]|nr:thermonuclease family protein [Bacteriovoracaceae bacterium]
MLLTKSQKISLLCIILLLSFSGYLFYLKWIKYQTEKSSQWEVSHVLDGDTVELFSPRDQKRIRVRMACMDAPEKDQFKIGDMSRKGLENKITQLQKLGQGQFQLQKTGVDIYGRTLGLLFHESLSASINELMIQQGFSFVHYVEGSVCLSLKSRLETWEFLAKQKGKGIFKYCGPKESVNSNCVKPWNWRKSSKKNYQNNQNYQKVKNKKLKYRSQPGLNAVEIAPKGFLSLNENF